ncbi:hypothetical protein PUN71_019055 [Arthrobacter sp. NQ7]|uniref:hypothetical protein n=1 Tax=Arthrobacter sp. NQ7 TaxID=3032303 RepID=UPI002410A416|nr:hypothetical protein [Arthrobacter sp. NQ7]MDJ0459308.1 hypothetical protein [Arthrobacter sp. NQ7]
MTQYPIYAQSGPPEWWQILAALGPWILLLAASIVGFIWWLALRQETKAVGRNDQWSRVVWALEASLDADQQKRRAGRAALDVLDREAVPGSDEAKIIAQARQGRSFAPKGGAAETDDEPN